MPLDEEGDCAIDSLERKAAAELVEENDDEEEE